MKRYLNKLYLISLAGIIGLSQVVLTGCPGLSNTNQVVQEWDYDITDPKFTLKNDTTQLTMHDVPAGSSVFIVRTNPTSSLLNDCTTVTGGSNITLFRKNSSSGKVLNKAQTGDNSNSSENSENSINVNAVNQDSMNLRPNMSGNFDKVEEKSENNRADEESTIDSTIDSTIENANKAAYGYKDEYLETLLGKETEILDRTAVASCKSAEEYERFVEKQRNPRVSNAERSAYGRELSVIDRTSEAVTYSDSNIGKVTKTFVTDYDYEEETCTKDNTTLRGIGYTLENGSSTSTPLCYVWVADDVYSTSEEVNKITDEQAQAIAQYFVKVYYLDTNILQHDVSHQICTGTAIKSDNKVDMSTVSPLGSVINIIIYDIDDDAENGSICGYVAPKDLFLNDADYYEVNGSHYTDYDYDFSVSNEGNFFYLDSYFASGSGAATANMSPAITTMAHEFQHMLQFNYRGIESNNEFICSSFFNEMLSMATEDVVFAAFDDISYDGETGQAAISYLESFERGYFNNGVERNTNISSLYYSTTYAFIAWAMRNFGGADVLAQCSTIAETDWDALFDSIRACYDRGYISDSEIMKKYAECCLVDTIKDYCVCTSNTTFNKAIEPYEDGYKGHSESQEYDDLYCEELNYGYPLVAINLKGDNNKSTAGLSTNISNSGNLPLAGVSVMYCDVCLAEYYYNMRPYGFGIQLAGLTEDTGDVTLDLSTSIRYEGEKYSTSKGVEYTVYVLGYK